jgi:hypothetical protein
MVPRGRICKRLRSLGIDYKESISSVYVAWRAGKTNSVIVPARQAGTPVGGIDSLDCRFLGSLNVYKFGLCCPGETVVVEKKKEADN